MEAETQLMTSLSFEPQREFPLDSHTYKSLFFMWMSGFRSHHSTKTALLRVTNDILLSSDTGNLNILILLDLTAAFDTINHSILLSRLQTIYNITGTALSWFTSYLTDRHQFIHINNCKSDSARLTQGVPQGSVLGPLLFILYILPLGQIIRHHGLHFHCFADDIQLYLSTKSINPVTHSTLTNCISEIKSWLKLNLLQLNCNKTEIILIGPKSLTNANSSLTLSTDGTLVSSSLHLRNLGIILDQTLSYEHHIKHITKTAFYHLRNIARLRPSLTPKSASSSTDSSTSRTLLLVSSPTLPPVTTSALFSETSTGSPSPNASTSSSSP
ncbi:hypothetical protein WMY93_009157 [Mugilogobius chulae]|uniref:Reverse transcriptase domain-containing protein n=1 Tax=Mugilogobius chulae TaxID=88201 RepID=A0AAW0PEL2_9GOBI